MKKRKALQKHFSLSNGFEKHAQIEKMFNGRVSNHMIHNLNGKYVPYPSTYIRANSLYFSFVLQYTKTSNHVIVDAVCDGCM